MRFFKLTHPPYATDREAERRNPVTVTTSHRLPGIVCELCGPWSSSHRVRVPLPPAADEFAQVSFLPPVEWHEARPRWAALLGVDADALAPGAALGPPSGTCSAAIREPVVHPAPGIIWVNSAIRNLLSAARLTGVSFAEVVLAPGCGDEVLFELVVHGRAWRVGQTPDSTRLCDICGRRGFPAPTNLTIDEARWDGFDFMIPDENPNIVVVSERVTGVLEAHGFANLTVVPI